jgi:hypothetical protein
MSIRARDIRIVRKDKLYKTRGTRNLVNSSIEIDPNILDYQSRVAGQGGTIDGKLEALTVLYQDWVANSIRTDLVRVNGWPTDTFAGFDVPLIYNNTDYNDPPLGGALDINTNFVSGDFSAVTGLKGNGIDKSLDSTFNPLDHAVVGENDIGMFAIVSDFSVIIGSSYDMGSSVSAFSSYEGGAEVAVSVSSGQNNTGIVPELGFLWVGRTNGSDIEITLNGSDYTVSQPTIVETTTNFQVFARLTGAVFGYSNRRLLWYGVSKYMTPVKRAALRSSLSTFDAAIGRPTY